MSMTGSYSLLHKLPVCIPATGWILEMPECSRAEGVMEHGERTPSMFYLTAISHKVPKNIHWFEAKISPITCCSFKLNKPCTQSGACVQETNVFPDSAILKPSVRAAK